MWCRVVNRSPNPPSPPVPLRSPPSSMSPFTQPPGPAVPHGPPKPGVCRSVGGEAGPHFPLHTTAVMVVRTGIGTILNAVPHSSHFSDGADGADGLPVPFRTREVGGPGVVLSGSDRGCAAPRNVVNGAWGCRGLWRVCDAQMVGE